MGLGSTDVEEDDIGMGAMEGISMIGVMENSVTARDESEQVDNENRLLYPKDGWSVRGNRTTEYGAGRILTWHTERIRSPTMRAAFGSLR